MADLSQYDPIFQAAGAEWNVDPLMLKAMATQESAGNPAAHSKANAQGLMQIIPETQRYLGVTDPTDPAQSIYGGAKYLSEALTAEHEDPRSALLYYHGGPGWRKAYGPESAGYVPGVAAHYQQYAKDAASSTDTAQPSAPDTSVPTIIGDSLAVGLGGNGKVGASPKTVLDNIAALSPDQMRGRDIVLSGGASNNPGQAGLVQDQIKALQGQGARSVTVLGVGDRSDLAGVNDQLAGIANRTGAHFVGIPSDQLGPDRIHPRDYKPLLAAVTAQPSAPAGAATVATPAKQTDNVADPFTAALGSPSGQSVPAPNAQTATADPFTAALGPPTEAQNAPGGIARNIAAGAAEGVAGATNVVSHPFGNLIGKPLATGLVFAHDALAPVFGYERFPADVRNALLGDTAPQPGTAVVNALARHTVGVTPEEVPANTTIERLARAAATGATGGALLAPGITVPAAVGAAGAVGGDLASRIPGVPDYAKPAAQLAGSVVGGVAAVPVLGAVNALAAGVNRFGNGPPPAAVAGPETAPALLSEDFKASPMAPGVQIAAAPGGPTTPVSNAPNSVGAAASREMVAPGTTLNLTPEQAAAARTTADVQWLNGTKQPGVEDTNEYIPGITPTLAQREQTAVASREQKVLRTAQPEVAQAERELMDANNQKRSDYYAETAGSEVTLANAAKARDDQMETALNAAFKNKGEADPAPVVQLADAIKASRDGRRPVVRNAVDKAITEMSNPDGTLTTDPEQLYGVRQHINDMLSKEAAREDPVSQRAAGHLIELRNALDGVIEPAAPGFQKAISDYAEASGPIDASAALLERESKLYDSQGRMQFSKVHSLMSDIIAARRPGAALNPLQGLTDTQMDRLKGLHDDLKRSASAEDLARAYGSDTAQNASDALREYGKMAATAATHGVANIISPGFGSMAVSGARNMLSPILAARTTRRQIQRGMEMLHPDPARYPTKNPLQPPP